MQDLEFDIEKVESLDYENIKSQLQYMFKTEQDIVNFVNFLKNIKNFVNLSAEKRHACLLDLTFFKSQISMFEKKILALINKKKSEQTRQAIRKLKGAGEKLTENTVIYYQEENTALEGLEELYTLVTCWYSYMQDLYYLCSQTNKNCGGSML